VRNFHQGFRMAWWRHVQHLLQDFSTAVPQPRASHAGYENLEPIAKLPAMEVRGAHARPPRRRQTHFDKLTDLYHSGTKHEEDQPAHLLIQDTNICNDRCVKEFGSPCQNFVRRRYEMVDDAAAPNGKRISLNPRTASLQDVRHSGSYQIITWVAPRAAAGRVMTGCNILG